MDYKEYRKNPLAPHLMPLNIRLDLIGADDVIKNIEQGLGKYGDLQIIQIQKDSIAHQVRRLLDYVDIFEAEESEENYQRLSKQIRTVEFMVKYFEDIQRNIKYMRLKQRIYGQIK